MRVCRCGGLLTQHNLTPTKKESREAWICAECGRCEVVKRLLNTNAELCYSSATHKTKRSIIPAQIQPPLPSKDHELIMKCLARKKKEYELLKTSIMWKTLNGLKKTQ